MIVVSTTFLTGSLVLAGDPGEAGFLSLRMGIGAREAGMGGAGVPGGGMAPGGGMRAGMRPGGGAMLTPLAVWFQVELAPPGPAGVSQAADD